MMYHEFWPRATLDSAGAESIVELGAGVGEFIGTLGNARRIAVELFDPYLERMRESYPALDIVRADARQWIASQPDKSIDVVAALNLIEHMEHSDGLDLIRNAKRVARSRVIVYTPLGFQAQHPEDVFPDFPPNPLQEHVSGWSLDDLAGQGFEVELVLIEGGAGGLYGLWSADS